MKSLQEFINENIVEESVPGIKIKNNKMDEKSQQKLEELIINKKLSYKDANDIIDMYDVDLGGSEDEDEGSVADTIDIETINIGKANKNKILTLDEFIGCDNGSLADTCDLIGVDFPYMYIYYYLNNIL